MGWVYLAKQAEFSASHRYWNPRWDEAKNQAVFGPCVRTHGHNYLVEVLVGGRLDPVTGMVINLTDLKAALWEVLGEFDHRHLTEDASYFAEQIPTTENIARVLWTLLEKRMSGAELARIRVWEDPDLCAEYVGDGLPAGRHGRRTVMTERAPGVCLTRSYRFSAGHRLHSHRLSDEENRRIYGKCNNPHGHGHTYTLEVTVRGSVHRETGMVWDLEALDRVVSEQVLARYDHRNLNVEAPEFLTRVPTSENLLLAIWEVLVQAIPRERLYRIRLRETRDNAFEYYGE